MKSLNHISAFIHLLMLTFISATGIAAAQATTTLISDNFSTSGALNGTTPQVTVAGAKWVALTGTGAATSNGSVLTVPAQNQSDVIDLGAGYFTTNPGIYTISMDVTMPAGSSTSFMGLGFVVNPVTSDNFGFATSNSGLNPGGGTNGGSPWVCLTQSGALSVDSLASTYIYKSAAGAYPAGSTYTLKLVLDTSKPQWTMSAFINSAQLDINGVVPGQSYTFTTNPTTIRYAGISTLTVTGNSSTVDNYSLTFTPPSDFPAAEKAPAVQPYFTNWVEGESYTSQTGGSIVTDAAAYAGKKWVVASSSSGASATYTVSVPTAGQYLLSLAGYPTGTITSSPISYSIDGGTAVAITGLSTSATIWGSSSTLAWNNAALITFSTAGTHTIKIALTGPRASDGTYAYALDALSLIAQPTDNLLYNDANYATTQWGATASTSSPNSSFPAANAMDGNPTLAWKPASPSPAQTTLTVTFPTARNLEALRLVKGANAPSGASMPTSYLIDLLENGVWVHRVNETSNLLGDVTYDLPGIVTATAMRLTVIATQGSNYAYVNQFEAYGPFGPEILAPVNAGTVGSSTYHVIGLTQPAATVNLLVNGLAGPVATADGTGWFSANVTLASGVNTIGAQAALNSVRSVRNYTTTTYSSGAPAALAALDRKGHHVIVNEGTNNLVVTGVGQSSSVGYTVANEAGTTIASGSLDLSNGAALLPLPASTAGWYQVVLSGSPALTQSISVLPNQFVLPALSPSATDSAMAGNVIALVPAADQPNFVPVVSDYIGMNGFGWSRARLGWAAVNPSAGVYDWTTTDTYINSLIAHGQNVMPLVSGFIPLNSHNSWLSVPDDLRTTYTWGQTLATHYLGRVNAYEFENECDISNNLPYQTVNTLMGHQRAFYLGVKSVAPNVIVAPNPPAYPAVVKNDVTNELQNLRGEAMDVFTFHWYPTYGSGQNEINMIQNVGVGYNMPENMATVTNMLENRAGWLSECGYSGVISGGDLPPSEELIQADFYAKMAPLAFSYGVNKTFAFCFPYYYEGTNQFGLLRTNGFSPRPAFNSTATVAQIMRTSQYYGSLNTGNANIEGLVFKNADGSYLLELWALNSTGVGAYTLPGGVVDTGVIDYLGRVTDTGSTTSVGVLTTAKFINLSGSTVTSVATASTNPYPNPSQTGIAPSPIVMAWHFSLPCKTASFEDYYDLVQNTATSCSLEVVNFSSTTYNGTIAVTPSNSRWTLTAGGSLAVSIPANGRVLLPFTLTAPALIDTVRVEARVDDSTGQTSSAAEILQTTGATTVPTAVQPDGSNNINIDCTAPLQNYFGYDGHLHWTPGTDGTVNYLGALPATGLTFTNTEMFKTPQLNYWVNLTLHGTWYYVWVKAKAGTGTSNLVNVAIAGNPASVNLANGITGFNTTTWTWSRTIVTTGALAQLGNSSVGNKTISVWSNDDGMLISKIVLTNNVSFVPTN
jgi:hypothetical protein